MKCQHRIWHCCSKTFRSYLHHIDNNHSKQRPGDVCIGGCYHVSIKSWVGWRLLSELICSGFKLNVSYWCWRYFQNDSRSTWSHLLCFRRLENETSDVRQANASSNVAALWLHKITSTVCRLDTCKLVSIIESGHGTQLHILQNHLDLHICLGCT